MGLYGKPVPMDMDMVVRKELKVTVGFAQARSSWEILLKLLEGNSLMLEPLVSTGCRWPTGRRGLPSSGTKRDQDFPDS